MEVARADLKLVRRALLAWSVICTGEVGAPVGQRGDGRGSAMQVGERSASGVARLTVTLCGGDRLMLDMRLSL